MKRIISLHAWHRLLQKRSPGSHPHLPTSSHCLGLHSLQKPLAVRVMFDKNQSCPNTFLLNYKAIAPMVGCRYVCEGGEDGYNKMNYWTQISHCRPIQWGRQRYVLVAKKLSWEGDRVVSSALKWPHAIEPALPGALSEREQLTHIIIGQSYLSRSLWVTSLRTERMTVPGLYPKLPDPSLPIQSFPFLHHPYLLIHFHSITFNVLCCVIWRNMECGHSIPGNSVVVQFNVFISFHFFIALPKGSRSNASFWPRSKLLEFTIYPFSFSV